MLFVSYIILSILVIGPGAEFRLFNIILRYWRVVFDLAYTRDACKESSSCLFGEQSVIEYENMSKILTV